MIWQPPTLKLLTLTSATPTQQVTTRPAVAHPFVATGTGFDERTSQLLFVRADVADGTLKPFQVIPCSAMTIKAAGNVQEISFTASLVERDAGAYHLVGWNPTEDDGLNQATVLERAMVVDKA